MKFWKNGAGRNASGRLFGVFDQYQWKIRLHYLAMGTGQTKILSHWRVKKKIFSLMAYLPTENPKQFFFQGLAGKKKKLPPA